MARLNLAGRCHHRVDVWKRERASTPTSETQTAECFLIESAPSLGISLAVAVGFSRPLVRERVSVILKRTAQARRVSLFEDPEHERIPDHVPNPMRESSDVFIAGGETRGSGRGETNLRSQSLPLPSDATLVYLGRSGSLSTLSRNSRVSPSDLDALWAGDHGHPVSSSARWPGILKMFKQIRAPACW